MATVLPFAASERPAPDAALTTLLDLVADDMASVNSIILARLQSPVALIPELAKYLIASGGKRLRPVLTVAAAKLCGAQKNDTLARARAQAACVEFIHTATLLHDDVVDNSDLRRGNPSANAVFGNEASVLVGDFLFARAFQLMTEDGSLEVLRILSGAAATIAEGEVLQLMTAGDTATGEQAYLDVVRAKTAELFASAAQVGAVVAGAEAEAVGALRTYGMNLGIAFQIADDVLDYSAAQAKLGKTVGDDFREGKMTLPVILAIARGNEAERTFWKQAMESHEQQGDGDLEKAQLLLVKHDTLADSISRARHYVRIARDALTHFPQSPLKLALMDVADFIVEREF